MNVEDLRRDSRVQEILRSMNDSPHIIHQTDEALLLFRHGHMKRVVLLSTPYYVYLLKHKGMSYYGRWPNTHLSVRAAQNALYITTEDSVADPPAALATPRAAVLSAEATGGNEFHSVKLEGTSSAAVLSVERWLSDVAASARLRAAVLAAREASTTAPHKAPGDKSKESGDEDEEKSDDISDTTSAAPAGHAAAAAAGSSGHHRHDDDDHHDNNNNNTIAAMWGGEKSRGLFHTAPSRYLAVASLVDGEFTDYAALRDAYVRREEDILLDDLSAFIRESEGQVERLCARHYPAFLHAARQCLEISEQDAELVGQELAGATALARGSVVSIKRAAADLSVSRCVGRHIAGTLSLLRASLAVAELLETAELRARQKQLLGAVDALRRLARVALPLSEYALGEYVIRHRVPAMTRDVLAAAVQQLKAWLRVMREHSQPVGRAALLWPGAVRPGAFVKRLATDEDSGEWWVEAEVRRASIRRAPFAQAEALGAVVQGAAVQKVFVELHSGAYFASYYAKSRAQQAKLDLYDISSSSSTSLGGGGGTTTDGADVVAALERHCAEALGFVLIEDIVHYVTRPHVQSASDILALWEQLSHALAERVRRAATVLIADPHNTQRMTEVFNLLRRFVNVAVEHVSSVPLSPLVLVRVVEMVSDNIISAWLQESCVEATEAVLGDALAPITVSSAEEYIAQVKRFALDRCRWLEMPVPSWPSAAAAAAVVVIGQAGPSVGSQPHASIVVLPYALLVPAIGDIALRFLSRCHSILVTDTDAVVRQSELNNVDEMLLKYLSVLFRTVTELLQGHLSMVPERAVMQLAVYVTSCTALSVVLSCVEQQFVLAWPGDYDGRRRQRIGEPRLLAPSAALLSKTVQRGIERLLAALVAEAEERLRPIAGAAYWRGLVDARKGHAARETNTESGGLPEAMEYVIESIPKLAAVLQTSVLRSVAGTVIAQVAITAQANIEQAVHSGCEAAGEKDFQSMRECVKEVELLTTALVPVWLKRIEAILPGLNVTQRFPFQPRQVANELMQWIRRREAEVVAERPSANQFVAGFEGAGKLVAKGVEIGIQAVGNKVKGKSNAVTGAASFFKGKRN